MKHIRTVFEERLLKKGWHDLTRDETGKYMADYINAMWFGYLLWSGIETHPNKI